MDILFNSAGRILFGNTGRLFLQGIQPSPSVTPSISVSPSITPSVTGTPSNTPSTTPSATPSISISSTPSISISSTPSISISNTPGVSPSNTPSTTPSATPSISISSTPSATPSISISSTPSATPSISITPSPTPSAQYTLVPYYGFGETPAQAWGNSSGVIYGYLYYFTDGRYWLDANRTQIPETYYYVFEYGQSVETSTIYYLEGGYIVTPSTTPSATPSSTPSTTPSVTPSITSTPSSTPSVTPSPSTYVEAVPYYGFGETPAQAWGNSSGTIYGYLYQVEGRYWLDSNRTQIPDTYYYVFEYGGSVETSTIYYLQNGYIVTPSTTPSATPSSTPAVTPSVTPSPSTEPYRTPVEYYGYDANSLSDSYFSNITGTLYYDSVSQIWYAFSTGGQLAADGYYILFKGSSIEDSDYVYILNGQ